LIARSLGILCVDAGHEKSALSRVKKLRQRISASFGRLCEYSLFVLPLITFEPIK